MDDKIPIEEAMKNMKQLVSEGLFDHIGLSEVSAETVKRAAAVRSWSFLGFLSSKGWVVLLMGSVLMS